MNSLHKIERYLDEHMIPFDVVAHPHTQTSLATARSLNLDPSRIAKGVLLEGNDCMMVAMIPADQEVQLGRLGMEQGQEFSLAEEKSVNQLFPDCDPGVIPGLPQAWGVQMIWDDALMAEPDIYLEAGDHERLVHVETKYLWDLFGDAPHCHFSQPRVHH